MEAVYLGVNVVGFHELFICLVLDEVLLQEEVGCEADVYLQLSAFAIVEWLGFRGEQGI